MSVNSSYFCSSSLKLCANPAEIPAPPPSHQLYAAMSPPIMRSKPAKYVGLPDQPDRAGMRKRRAETEMTISQLQHNRGVATKETPENSFLKSIKTDGYNLLISLATDVPKAGMSLLNACNNAMSFWIGPPSAEAAPVVSSKLTASDFVEKHSRDFEIWLNPAAKNTRDMKGVVIVIGEHHYDPAVQASIKKVMLGFRSTRGDRFFLEGGELQICKERTQRYVMDLTDCTLLEKNTATFQRGHAHFEQLLQKGLACVEHIIKHIPESEAELHADNIYAYTEFIRRHSKDLPIAARPKLNSLVSDFNRLADSYERGMTKDYPAREQDMNDAIRKERSISGWNYVLIGSDHIKGMRAHLQDLPCIFMMPRLMVQSDPSLSLETQSRQDL